MSTIDFSGWTRATGDLKPGQQAVFLDVLNLVSEGQAHLVWGANYREGKPCLVNAVAQMLSHNAVSPTGAFGSVVVEFDRLNEAMLGAGINEDGYVSPLAADFLIRNFGEVKAMEFDETPVAQEVAAPYVEPSDEEFTASWLEALRAPAPDVVASTPVGEGSDEVEYARAFVDFPKQ